MTKEFLPYDLALELKELGFDEPCLSYYFKDYKNRVIFVIEKDYYEDLMSNIVHAPLYQQAFRWFREEYKLNHLIEFDYPYYNAVVNRSLVEHCETYEEAELECLKQLIKIVKNK